MSRRPPKKQPRLPPGVLKPGTQIRRRRPIRSGVLVAAGVIVALLVGLAVLGSVGNGDDDGKSSERPGSTTKRPSTTTTAEQPGAVAGEQPAEQSTETSAAAGSEVSVQLRATDAVWVCLIDDAGERLVNSETLDGGEKRGPFDGQGFEMTFGNGSVRVTVDGEPVEVPAGAEPIGYRIAPGKVRRLDGADQPTCS